MPPPRVRDPARSFGNGVGPFLLIVAAWLVWRDKQALAMGAAVIGIALLILARFAPTTLRMPSGAWWRLAHALGWLNARILLTAMFVALFTPLGLIRRVVGRGGVRRLGGAPGWAPYPPRFRNPKHFERMF